MKTKEVIKKIRAMNEKKLFEEVKKLQDTVQSTRLQISSKKTTAYDKAKKTRVQLAQVKTIIKERKNQPTVDHPQSERI